MPIALVSASPRRIVEMVLRTVGAFRFRLSVAAEDAPRAKPAPDPYLTAAAALGADPRAAGCHVIVVGTPDRAGGTGSGRQDSRGGGRGDGFGPAPGGAPHDPGVGIGTDSTGVPPGPGRTLKVSSLEEVDLPLLQHLAAGEIPLG
jgi:hypothetical protein